VGSWSQGTDDGLAGGAETPGAANTVANAAYITALLGDCGLLSAHAVSLEAWRHSSSIRLEWMSTGEPQPLRFVVERIAQQGDAFATVAEIPFSASTSTYSWNDPSAPADRNCLYRIRSLLPDGREVLSPVVEVKTFVELQGGVAVFPNPSHDAVTFQFDAEGEGQLILCDLQGKVIYTSGTQLFTGFSELQPDLSHVAPGLYAWRLSLGPQLLQGRLLRK
jgi:hypothetical protein